MTMIDPDDIAARLKDLDSDFKRAPDKPPGGGFVRFKPPEGVYWATVEKTDVIEIEDVLYLKIVFAVVHDGFKDKHKGEVIEKLYVLEPQKLNITPEQVQQRLGFLRQDLHLLGVDVENIEMSDVRPGSPIWDDVLDRNVELAVKFNRRGKKDRDGDLYRDIYINRSDPPLVREKSDIPNDLPASDYKPTKNDEEVPF